MNIPLIDGTIYWTNGFYKNLRVWDGDLISIDTIEEIERLYSDEQIVKITGLIAYYPLKGQGYFIKDGQCVKGVNFFKVPGRYSDSLKIDVSSLNLNESSSINGVTVTFWIRPFAFVDKIFEYYEGYSVLKYNGDNINDKDTFGLSLIIGSTEDTRKTYAIDNNFRDKIGIWSYISLAYHRYKTEDSII